MSPTQLLIIAIFLVASTCAQDYGMLFKFLKHRSTVFDLDLMLKSVESDAEDVDRFLSSYSDNYRNSTQWIWSVVVVQGNSVGLLETVKLHNEFHYGKIKLFFDQIIETFDMASKIEVANSEMQNEDHLPLKTQHGLWRAQLLQQIDAAMKDLVTSEWLPAAKTTVRSLLDDRSSSDGLAEEVLSLLKAKFPFRAWMVLTTTAGSDSFACLPDAMLLLPPQQLVEGFAHVLHADPLQKEGPEVLDRIAASKTVNPFRCHRQSAAIFAEMAESCAEIRRSNAAVGVFAEAFGQEVRGSDETRLKQRSVTRSFWKFCQQKYSAFSFQ